MYNFLDENDNGLVAYWHFNEGTGTKVFDESKNINNGVMINGPIYQSGAEMLSGLCILKSPTFLEYIQDTKPIFSWSSVYDDGAGFQKFQLWLDGSLNKDNLLDSSWTITTPLNYGQHTWFVKGFDALGNNQSSYSRTFYIDNKPPNAFNLVTPTDSEIVNLPTPSLSWQATLDSAGGSGLSKYQLWINNTTNRDSIPIGATTASPGNALSQGAYNWFIRAYDAVGNFRQSTQTRTFYVDYEPPAQFTLNSPANADTIKVKRPTFVWHPSADIGSGIVKYELNISGQTAITVSPTDTMKQVPFDLPNGNYNWFVKAFDRANAFTSSNTNALVVYVPTPPLPPQLTYPPNNSQLGDDLTPDLAWNTVANASYFHVQIASDSLFTKNVIENTNVNALNWTPTMLTYGTYYWRVRTYSAQGVWSDYWSEVRKFGTSLAVPILTLPSNNVTNLPTSIELKWNRSINADMFILQVGYDSSFTKLFLSDSTVSDTSKKLDTLFNNTKYYWRVCAKNNAGISGWSDTWNFTTIIAAPAVPTLINPLANSSYNAQPIVFRWNKAERSTNYRLQIATDSSMQALTLNDSLLADTMRTLSGLEMATLYYWRVRASNVGGVSDWSGVWSFKTLGLPTTVNLLEPQNGTVDQPVGITFKWSKAEDQTIITPKKNKGKDFSPNGTLTISNYWFEIVKDTVSLSGIIKDEVVVDTFKTIANLDYLTKYYWRIKSKNQTGWSEFTNWNNFTTRMNIPAIPLLKTPLKSTIVSLKPVLKWGSAIRAENYNLQISIDATFSSFIFNDSTLTDTTKMIDSLDYKAKYYWRVSANNSSGTSGFSDIWDFTTTYKPLNAPTNLTVTASNVSEVILSWVDNSDNEQGFIIQRKTGDSSSAFAFDNIDTVAVNMLSTKDTKVADTTTYTYRVFAFNQDTISDFSNYASVKTISDVEWTNERPTVYNLFQSYPNPFNPSTIIRYSLPFESKLTIKIYNTLGQEVEILKDDILSAGNYEVQFNSSSLPSGVYFYRLSAESLDGKQKYSSIKKMILLK